MDKQILKKNPWVPGKYADTEAVASDNLRKLAPHLPMFFSSITEMPYGNVYDFDAVSSTGSQEVVELKTRDESAINYKTCYIEPEKWVNLMKYWREDDLAPLYLNFIGDYTNTYIFFLPQVETPKFYTNVLVKSDDGKYEEVDRLGLKWENAYHYYLKDNEWHMEYPKNVRTVNKKAKKVRND